MNQVQWKVECGGESRVVSASEAMGVAEEMHGRLGTRPVLTKVEPAAKAFSEFGGALVTDAEGKARVEAQHAKIEAALGAKVGDSEQLYATGTRMARVGYEAQEQRAVEHAKLGLLSDEAGALVARVEREQREDVVVSAAEFGEALTVNGKVKAFGLAITEQAIRGLTFNLESDSLRYLLGLRSRVSAKTAEVLAFKALPPEEKTSEAEASAKAAFAQATADKAKLADVIRHECRANPNARFKMRTRKGVGDVFAILSPTYGVADAPQAVPEILDGLPKDARGSYSYDPATTAWELRASIWTPTSAADQVVGEAFEAYASFQSRDNGTSRLRGGGGIELVRCLNASTYVAEGEGAQRRHSRRVMTQMEALVGSARKSIDVMVEAWGLARREEVAIPSGAVSLNEAIPGFWSYLLRDQRSELAGILPGRSREHVEKLTQCFWDERRDDEKLVRSDLANGWTRYAQSFDPGTRREAEKAIGRFVVDRSRIGCDLERAKG